MARNDLPPDCEVDDLGKVWRILEREAADGKTRIERHQVASTLEEAREKRMDFYHPQYGWIIEGYKLGVDRDVASIMAESH